MKSKTFFIRLPEERKLAEQILENQVVTSHVIKLLYDTVRDIEGVNQDKTRDLMETRLTRINQNGLKLLLQLIELHNARSELCANFIKETQ